MTTIELQVEQSTTSDSIFGNRNFRLLWLGEAISLIGDQFYLIALPWLVLQITGDALAMGTMMAVGGIPRAVFMLLGGALSDRFQPRTVMLGTNLIRMVLVTILSVIVISGVVQLWMLYVFALIFGLADAFFFPAQSAIVPRVILRSEQLQTANSIVQGTAQFSLFAGPVLAGIIIAMMDGNKGDTTGIGIAFGIDALTFLASAFSLWLMKTSAPSGGEESQTPLQAIRDGLAYTWNDKLLRYFFIMIGLANIFINGPIMVGIPVLADTRLPEGAAAFGIIMSAFGGGSLLGIIVAGVLPKLDYSRLGTVLFVTWASMGFSIAALGFVTSTPVAAAITFFAGAANGYVVILFITWLQERTPENYLGRVMSVLIFASVGLLPVSTSLTGALIEVSTTGLFVTSGLIMSAIVFIAMTNPGLRLMDETRFNSP